MSSLERWQKTIQLQTDLHVAIIPTGTVGSEQLFNCLKFSLDFPEYFGGNWNALDECITDLSWVKEKNVVIYHETFPVLSSYEASLYWDTLKSASDYWLREGSKTLLIVFGLALDK